MKVSRRVLLLSAIGIVAVGSVVAAAYSVYGRNGTTQGVVLPAGCVRPSGGFLLVASYNGYNDSVDHGVPAKPWPTINAPLGENITLTVCNADSQPHGFQIAHYYDPARVGIKALAPGQVLTMSFRADEAGSFQIYCSIPCSVHWAMQNGQLNVS